MPQVSPSPEVLFENWPNIYLSTRPKLKWLQFVNWWLRSIHNCQLRWLNFFSHTYECINFLLLFYGPRRSLLMIFPACSTFPLSVYPLPLPFRSYSLAVSLRAILHKTENLFIGYFHGFRSAENHEDAQTRRSWWKIVVEPVQVVGYDSKSVCLTYQ